MTHVVISKGFEEEDFFLGYRAAGLTYIKQFRFLERDLELVSVKYANLALRHGMRRPLFVMGSPLDHELKKTKRR